MPGSQGCSGRVCDRFARLCSLGHPAPSSTERWRRSRPAKIRPTISGGRATCSAPIELETGLTRRVVRGTGAETSLEAAHPDTKRPIVGTLIPQWEALTRLVISAAEILPGIRAQSWDVALAADGPVLLEVNYGGDLNLAQLAHGVGVLDEPYAEHLDRCGYRS